MKKTIEKAIKETMLEKDWATDVLSDGDISNIAEVIEDRLSNKPITEQQLKSFGEYLKSIGYTINMKDPFWMEEYLTEHKIKDVAELVFKYLEFKTNS